MNFCVCFAAPRRFVVLLVCSLTFLCSLATVASAQDFSPAWEFPAKASEGRDAVFFDVDLDADLDVMLLDSFKGSSLFLNDGSGTLTYAPASGLGVGFAAAVGDLNGDTYPDVVFGRLGVSTYTNAGDGTFSFDSSFAFGYTASSIALEDFNNDGHLDVLVTDTATDPGVIYTNNGSGAFSLAPSPQLDGSVQSLAVGDVNQDGWMDVMIGRSSSNSLYYGATGLVFTAQAAPEDNDPTYDIGIADLNGDLWPDIWLMGDVNQVWINDGTGAFPTQTTYIGSSGIEEEVELVDVNGDLAVDAVTITRDTTDNQFWLNDGTGVFTLGSTTLGNAPALGVGFGDLDGDADPDAVLTPNQGPASLFLRVPGAEGGPYRHEEFISGGINYGADAGDIDGDGDIDVVAVLGLDAVYHLNNNSNGQFQIEYPALLYGYSQPLTLIDIDLDNDLDLFIHNQDSEWFRLFKNDGAGTFTLSGPTYASANPSDLVPGDFNEDGWPDLLVTTRPLDADPGQNFLLLNNSNSTFSVTNVMGTGSTQSGAAGDFNGDGDLDVVLGNTSTNTVWRQNMSDQFIQTSNAWGSSFTYDVLIEDFTGDSEPDVVTLENGFNYLFINDGGGSSFTETLITLSGAFNSSQGAAFDADEDGDLDLWIGNGFTSEQVDRLFLNDGSGTFTLGTAYPVRETRVILAEDFDGDGLTDIWVGSGRGDHALYSRKGDVIVEYAEGFGLTGPDTDPLADPDGDLLPNWAEFAFNLNPDLSDNQPMAKGGTFGAPRMGFGFFDQSGSYYIEGSAIRPIGISSITYTLHVGDDMTFPDIAPGSPNTEPINSEYERISLWRFFSSAGDIEFGYLEVNYNP